MDDDKIKVPEDFPGEPEAPEQPEQVDPVLDNDPDVLAAKKKNKLLHLKLDRYKEIAGTVGTILQTFKAEAMSLTSGVGTLVVGWFQIRKWVAHGRSESRVEGRAMGREEGRAAERSERKEGKAKVTPTPNEISSISGAGYGSGSGKLGATETRKIGPLVEKMESVQPLMAVAEIRTSSFMLDPMNYATIILPIVFAWTSKVAWNNRKKKLAEKGGRRNGQ